MKQTIIVFGCLILALLLVFQFGKYAMISGDLDVEIMVAVIALIFFVVGVYINKKSLHKSTKPHADIDEQKIKALEISTREYEVLQNIAEGLSNKEIAECLFLSESTIKTHVSNLLIKLNAKRRTQAVKNAKAFQIL